MNEDLKAYLDNELSPARRAEVEAALQQDPLLQAEFEQLRSITESLRGYIPMPQPTGYENLAARLQKAPVGRPWWTKPLPLATSLLAVVAIGAVGTRQMLEQRDSQPMFAQETAASDIASRKEEVGAAPESASFGSGGGGPIRNRAEANMRKSGQALLLVVTDVSKAEKEVEKLATSLKGTVSPTKNREFDHVALRLVVPQEKFEEARSGLSRLGSLKQSSQTEMESSIDVDGDSIESLRDRYYEAKQNTNSKESELKKMEARIAKLEAEMKAIEEGRLVEIRLTINARSKGVP